MRARPKSPSLPASVSGAKAVLVEPERRRLPFDVLPAKIRPPVLGPDVVSRTALVNRLRAERSARAVALVAPGGYGKTTLLAQWALRDDRPFAWISLDRRDNDPIVLLRHVAAAMDEIALVDARVLDALASPGASPWTSSIPRIAAMIATSDPFVLVLDDAQQIADGGDAAEVLTLLAEHVPARSALVLSGRAEHEFVTKLRTSSPLLELDVRDLALTPREAELLLRAAGSDLSDEDRAALIRDTEGWAAALYLATLSLKRPRPANAPDEPAAVPDGRYITDYFHAEYLAGLEPERLSFLRRTAILDKMCGALCDATLAQTGSFDELRALSAANLFIVPLDAHAEWYRYHHLFQEMLRRELLETEPELARVLGRRAAEWFEANGDPESALDLSLSVGDTERAARLFSEVALPTYSDGRATTVALWLEQFDEETLEHYPDAAVQGARLHALRGSTSEAERWLELAEAHAERGDPTLPAQAAVLRAYFCRDGVGTMLSDAGSAVSALPATSDWRFPALFADAAAHSMLGEEGRAAELLEEALGQARRADFGVSRLLAIGERILLAEQAHEHARSEQLDAELAELLEGGSYDAIPTAALPFAARARVQLRHGRWDSARALVEHARGLTTWLTDALPWLAVQARLEIARTFIALRDVAPARELLLEIDDIFERRPDLGVLADRAETLRDELAAVPVLDHGKGSNLTAAEMRLMPFLPTHLSFREIGDQLHLSRNTIKTQAISVYRKLGVSTRGGAIEEAVRLGLAPDTGPVRQPPPE